MWKNKVVIISGSSIGIGRRLAIEIGKKGGKVVINARNQDRLDATLLQLTEDGINAFACPGDISKFEDCKKIIERAISHYGKLDVLINNAGIVANASVETIHPEVFRKVVEVNFLGAFFITKLAIPYLKKTRGSVLFVSSLAGIHGIGNYASYSSSKMALTALAESLRIELHPYGVHIGIAYVGFTENDPEKTFLDGEGERNALPDRKTIRQISAKKVALHLLQMIERRRYRSICTPLGKFHAFVTRIFPNVVHRFFLRRYIRGQD
jgi:NAD(P)-dependent dehydrogenase (short-subunit alcohol dehydrogenase family)